MTTPLAPVSTVATSGSLKVHSCAQRPYGQLVVPICLDIIDAIRGALQNEGVVVYRGNPLGHRKRL